MKIGDLVTFCPEAWGTPLEDRPLGIIMNVEKRWHPDGAMMVTAIFPGIPRNLRRCIKDFEVVNENW
jgi:hypothetical protein